MTAIDEVKQKTDILDVVSQYVKLTKAGKMYRGLCPFHSEKHGSFFVYPEQQTWHCFGACATGGDVFSFIMKKEGMDFAEALRLMARKAGVVLPESPEVQAKGKEKDRLYEINQVAAEFYHAELLKPGVAGKALEYARKRGLSDKTIDDFQLGYSPDAWEALKKHLTSIGYKEDELVRAGVIIQGDDKTTHDRFRGKLMFPVRDERGHVTGFGSRVLDDSTPKYINSPQTEVFDKSACLYGINLAAPAIRKLDKAIIVEGYMDTLIAHQFGFSNVVAAMGTAITEKQLTIIKRLCKNVIYVLDPDIAGAEAMIKAGNVSTESEYREAISIPLTNPNIPTPSLNERQVNQDHHYQKMTIYASVDEIEFKVATLPTGKDPDDVIKEDSKTWQSILDKAIPVVDYIFSKAIISLDLNTAQGKTQAVEKLIPIIGEIKSTIRQAHYVQKLATIVKVDAKRLQLELDKSKQPKLVKNIKIQNTSIKNLPELTRRRVLSNPIEEYLLSLLIQHPDLKGRFAAVIPAEYFEDSGNRAILNALITQAEGELKDRIVPEMAEKIDQLKAKALPDDNLEQKFTACILTLRERYLRNRELEKEAVLALEMEAGGTPAELAKLKEQGIDGSNELKKVFYAKASRRGKKAPGDSNKAG